MTTKTCETCLHATAAICTRLAVADDPIMGTYERRFKDERSWLGWLLRSCGPAGRFWEGVV